MWTVNFQMFKLDLEKAEEPEIKLPTSAGSWKKQESSRKTSISAILIMPKGFDCVDHNKLWKILKEMGIPDDLTCLLRNLYAGQEATVTTGHGTTDWSGGQREELRPWQRSWGRRLGICKAWSSLRKPPIPGHLTPKPESVLCSHLRLWLYGGLSPITVSLGEGVNVQLQGNKNSWAWQECFSLRTPLKVI